MSDKDASWEAAIRETAASFPYPPTPPIAAGVRQRLAAPPPRWTRRRLAYAAMLLLLLAGLLAVPPVRAALVSIIRAGAIAIFVGEPTATAVPPTPVSEAEPVSTPTSSPLETTVFDLADRTTLEEAQAQARFPLRQPAAYGPPDEVYLQKVPDPDLDGQVVIMVWRDPAQPEQARLLLYQIGVAYFGLKQASGETVAQTEVNGQTAYWVEGGHRILLYNDQEQESFFVEGNVLIWVEGAVTYRLESELSLEVAVEVAESLSPVKEEE